MNGLLRATSKFKVCSTPNSTRRASQEQSVPIPHLPPRGTKAHRQGPNLHPTTQLQHSGEALPRGWVTQSKSCPLSEPQGVNMGEAQRPGGWLIIKAVGFLVLQEPTCPVGSGSEPFGQLWALGLTKRSAQRRA